MGIYAPSMTLRLSCFFRARSEYLARVEGLLAIRSEITENDQTGGAETRKPPVHGEVSRRFLYNFCGRGDWI